MEWERFHFLCRQYQADPERLLPTGHDGFQAGELTAYRRPLSKTGLPQALLSRLKNLSAEDRHTTLAWYGEQDFHALLSPPPVLRNGLLYLTALSVALAFMMAIYGLVVLPAIHDFYLTAGVPGSAPAFALMELGRTLLMVVIGLLALVWLFTWQLRALYRFRIKTASRWRLRLLPFGIGGLYREVVALIEYPLYRQGQPGSASADHAGLASMSCQRVLGIELHRLLRVRAEKLARRVALSMRLSVVLLGVLVAVSVGLFLVGAYSPLFATGAMV